MNVIITGASRGIGYQLVKLFAQCGDCTIFAISRNTSSLNKLVKDVQPQHYNSTIIPLAYDLEKQEDVKKIKATIATHTKHIDYIVNNAGALVNKPFEKISFNELNSVYTVNVFAPFLLIQTLLPLLGKKKISHIVNISSMGGVQGSSKFKGLSAYSSSKAAIAVLTECLAEELKEKNIRLNCLALGAVQTEMLSKAFPGYKAPLSATQMAEYILQFTITGSAYFNGKIIPVSLSTP